MTQQDSTYKEIIYLDEVELNSALAQLQGGLKQSFTDSNSSNQSKKTGNNISVKGNANIGSVIAKAAVGAEWQKESEISNSESVGKAINIVFKDYQLERLIQTLGTHISSEIDNVQEGDFISVSGNFRLLNFTSISEVLDGHVLKNLMKQVPVDENDPKKGTQWDKNTEKGFKLLKYLSDFCQKLTPDNTLILMDNAAIYAEQSNFRTNQGQIGTINGTQRPIHILGIVESFAGSEKNDLNAIGASIGQGNYADLGGLVNSMSESVLTSLGIIKKGNRLIKPIAIYFENN